MIDLSKVRAVLDEVETLIKSLDGKHLDDADAVENQSKGRLRQERARMSQDLQLLATRLELAAGLARVEYWFARGETDPLDSERAD